MGGVFVYWDSSNIHHEAQRIAEERDGTPGARYLVRIHFDHLLRLAHADRPLTKAVAAGSVPPEMHQLWNRMESAGVEVSLFDRGSHERGEQDIPDRWLQLRMLEDGWDHNGDAGIVALLTGWRIEVLSWLHSCKRDMREWATEHGVFVPLDTYYDAITFREPSRPGHELAPARDVAQLDLSGRQMA